MAHCVGVSIPPLLAVKIYSDDGWETPCDTFYGPMNVGFDTVGSACNGNCVSMKVFPSYDVSGYYQ